MHINLESDYAVRIVHYLSQEYLNDKDKNKNRIDAQTISNSISVSLRFTLKIMRKLVAAEIVNSFKGAHGGYTLAKHPADVTFKDVIDAVEGPYKFSRCNDNEYDCNCTSFGSCCPFRHVFDDITELVNDKLSQVNFASLSCKK